MKSPIDNGPKAIQQRAVERGEHGRAQRTLLSIASVPNNSGRLDNVLPQKTH